MNVIIYESSSKGGCYEYAQYLFRAFQHTGIKCTLVLPEGSELALIPSNKHCIKLLANDQKKNQGKIFSKISFLWRQLYNPIRFIFFLYKQPKCVVIWNDFEQLSAGIWTFLLRILVRKHSHVIVLHDPDRDQYPPSKAYSIFCMKRIMKCMDLALYHQYLPEKSYYQNTAKTYRSIVHGTYDVHAPDPVVLNRLQSWKKEATLLSVLGNIRQEKNYNCILESLAQMPNSYKLLIAGAAANSAVDIEAIQSYAKTLGLSNRIYWENKFLSDAELSACIQASDIILLYYKPQFTSQSGILNLLAPYKKKFVFTDSASGLERTCKENNIGVACSPNDSKELARTIQFSNKQFEASVQSWENYLDKADWIKAVEVIQQWYQEQRR
jgi:glycosyltransferase involved in cell wall biosynthesis